jgi:hypothetical protein
MSTVRTKQSSLKVSPSRPKKEYESVGLNTSFYEDPLEKELNALI